MSKAQELLKLIESDVKSVSLHDFRRLIAQSMKAVGAPEKWISVMGTIESDPSWSSELGEVISDLHLMIKRDDKDPSGEWEDSMNLLHDALFPFIERMEGKRYEGEHEALIDKIVDHLKYENNPFSQNEDESGEWSNDIKKFKKMHPNIDLDAADNAAIDDESEVSFQDQMRHQGYKLREKDGFLYIITPYVSAKFKSGSGDFEELVEEPWIKEGR